MCEGPEGGRDSLVLEEPRKGQKLRKQREREVKVREEAGARWPRALRVGLGVGTLS